MADEMGRDLPDGGWHDDVVSSLFQPLEWFADLHRFRVLGDEGKKRSVMVDAMLSDCDWLDQHVGEEDQLDNNVEAAISALCQSSGVLFSYIADGQLDRDQLKTRISQFLSL